MRLDLKRNIFCLILILAPLVPTGMAKDIIVNQVKSGCEAKLENTTASNRGNSLYGYTTKGLRWDVKVSGDYSEVGRLISKYDDCNDVDLSGTNHPVPALGSGWGVGSGYIMLKGKRKTSLRGADVSTKIQTGGDNGCIEGHASLDLYAGHLLSLSGNMGFLSSENGSRSLNSNKLQFDVSSPFYSVMVTVLNPKTYTWNGNFYFRHYTLQKTTAWVMDERARKSRVMYQWRPPPRFMT